MTESDVIGVVATFPIPELLRLLSGDGILVYERRSQKGDDSRYFSEHGMIHPFERRVYGETELFLFKNQRGDK